MTEFDFQTIQTENATVFTEDGGVFIDMTTVLPILLGDVSRSYAEFGEDMPEAQAAYFIGQIDILNYLAEQVNESLAAYRAQQ